MAAQLNFLQVDALVPLAGAADLKEGFTRVPLALCPPFSGQETVYHVAAPSDATALSVCASSFAAADVRISGTPGSLLQLPLPAGVTELPVAVTLHARPEGATLATYTVHAARTAAPSATAPAAQTVKIDTSAPTPPPAGGHGHSHNGVPCDGKHESHGHAHDHGHGHGHGHKEAAAVPEHTGHGHSHGGVPCSDPSHSHGHGHGAAAAAPAHGHSHETHHGHSHDHGHGHGAVRHVAEGGDSDESDSDSSALHAALHGHGHGHNDGALVTPPGAAYAWGQDGDTVTVEIPVPPSTRAADVACVIGAARLDVSVKSITPPEKAAVLAGALAGRVSRDDSSWSLLDDGGKRVLVLTLAKEGGERAKKWGALLA